MIFLTSLIVIIIVFEVRNRIFDLLVTIISLISEMGIKPRMKRRVNRGRNFLFYIRKNRFQITTYFVPK